MTDQVITDASIQEKIEKGEELTAQEQEHIKGNPNSEHQSAPVQKKDGEDIPEEIKIPKEAEAGASDLPKKTDDEKPKPAAEETKKPTPEERQKLIEAELEKPEANQDLTKFSPSEIGTYLELKRERKRRQKAEDDLEILRVERISEKLKKDLKPAVEEADPLAFLSELDDEDILTAGQGKKIAAALKELKAKPAEEAPKKAAEMLRTPEQVRSEVDTARAKLATSGIDDFDEVTSFAEAVLKDDNDAREILIDVAKAGGNTVERTYFLIKGSKHWPEIEKRIKEERARAKKKDGTKPSEENLSRAKRLEDNETKIKTTGPGSGTADAVGEYTEAEIANMTIDDIKKLPKSTRQLILKKFGSEPNFNR